MATKKTNLGKKKIKVHSKYIRMPFFTQNYNAPEIRLCGKWLQNIGFHIGKQMTVTHERNKIILTLWDED